MSMLHTRAATFTVLTLTALAVMAASVMAVAPTKEAVKKWQAEGVWQEKVANWQAFKRAGGCSPEEHSVFHKDKDRQSLALGEQTVDTVNVIVILVDFTDWPYTGQSVAGDSAAFDSILFSDRETDTVFNPTGSMTDYYVENSYGQFYLQGDIFGWYRMPQTYDWYVGDDDGLTNGRILARDAVDSAGADTNVDFSRYDLDSNGICDGVIIVHAGRGAEEGVYGIWSHKSNLPSARHYDGVTISAYTMNPEEAMVFGQVQLTPIGVFCHEYGHFLGLPDLYDVDYNPGSSGLGYWSIMASGNQLSDGRRPAHFDAWCKSRMHFLDLIEVTANLYQAELPAIEYNPVAYRLSSFFSLPEYWVVENRMHSGFDALLPGAGLCIYHVDTLAPINNTDPNRYYVAMEQADGKNDLALHGSRGDNGDPWRSPIFPEFHNLTTPNTRTNIDTIFSTRIGFWRITAADSIMYADLDIEYSRPWIELSGTVPFVFNDDQPGGNGNSVLEAGETIQFYCTVTNQMRSSYNVHATLSTDNQSVTFIDNDVAFGEDLVGLPVNNASAPITFTLDDSLVSSIDSFFLTITTDSLPDSSGSGEFSKTFGFEVYLGAPQVLLVDDDQGNTLEENVQNTFARLRIPIDTWHTDVSGSPAGVDLLDYQAVFWHTGDSAAGVLDSSDIAAMKLFLDNGRGLFLTTASGVIDIDSLDPSFLSDYLHATHVGSGDPYYGYEGVDGNDLGDGTKYVKYDQASWTRPLLLEPVNGGEAAFLLVDNFGHGDSACGVTYSGAHKSILLTFSAEYIDNQIQFPGVYPSDTLIARSLKFFGGVFTSVYDGQPFGQLPRSFELHQNYPNPFNPVTNISYTLRAARSPGAPAPKTNLSIYNILGRHVKTLVDKIEIPGTYVVPWDGTDRYGRPVASGVYFYRLVRGGDSQSKKMVLIR